MSNAVFRESPPKIIVFESVEREFPNHLKAALECAPVAQASHLKAVSYDKQLVQVNKLFAKPNYVERIKLWKDIDLVFVVRYYWHSVWRNLVGVEKTSVREVNLSRAAPFSSVVKNRMLVYKDDFASIPTWHAITDEEMDCRIEKLRSEVEANGITKFVLMIAPNKLTAYADFIAERRLRSVSGLKRLSDRHRDIIPPTFTLLDTAIRAGEMDVYLPDDTHWGSSGHRIAAKSVLELIRRQE